MSRGFKATKTNPEDLFDAIIALHSGKIKLRQARSKFNVTSRALQTTMCALHGYEKKLGKSLEESSSRIQVTRWAAKYTVVQKKVMYKETELHEPCRRNFSSLAF